MTSTIGTNVPSIQPSHPTSIGGSRIPSTVRYLTFPSENGLTCTSNCLAKPHLTIYPTYNRSKVASTYQFEFCTGKPRSSSTILPTRTDLTAFSGLLGLTVDFRNRARREDGSAVELSKDEEEVGMKMIAENVVMTETDTPEWGHNDVTVDVKLPSERNFQKGHGMAEDGQGYDINVVEAEKVTEMDVGRESISGESLWLESYLQARSEADRVIAGLGEEEVSVEEKERAKRKAIKKYGFYFE